MKSPRVLVYGDVNLNYRDGSAIWLQSICWALHIAGAQVELLIKADVDDDEALAPFRAIPDLAIHTPFNDRRSGKAGMPPREAARRINAVDRSRRPDLLITRGFDIATHVAASGRFDGRFWAYLTEGAAFELQPSAEGARLATSVALSAQRIMVQTEQARSTLEALVPEAAGKTIVFTPVVPDEAFALFQESKALGDELSLVYSGKFAEAWNTLEMTSLPAELASRGVPASVTMIGDKVQGGGGDGGWVDRMKRMIDNPPVGVEFLGGMQRMEALSHASRFSLGLCWRDPKLDSSLEISTKLLEFAAVGVAPVLNRTAMHEELFGADYPLFVDRGNIHEVLERAYANPALIDSARHIARTSVLRYSMEASAERLRSHLYRSVSGQPRKADRKHRVLLAGHDFKFAGELIDMLDRHPDFDLRIDKWHRLAVHDENASLEAAEWADTIICEWCGPNAVFFSNRVRDDQRLLVRFHGFEIRGQWLKDLMIDRVDTMIFVTDFYRRTVLQSTAWPERITTVIPNTIDCLDLDRAKLPRAKFTIGLAGFVPMLKRPDRALDLLRLLRLEEPRFKLRFRGRLPWTYPWEWNKPWQRDAYEAFFARISQDELLSESVFFDPFGPDMASWLRGIGWMLSPSTRETFHLAPVEGMASGALPVVWTREGAEEVFGKDLVHDDTDSAARYILDRVDNWAGLQADMKLRVAGYDASAVQDLWFNLIKLGKSDPIPLRGTPLLHDVTEVEDAGALGEAVRHLLDEGRVTEADRLLGQKGHLLPEEGRASILLREGVSGAAVLESWVKEPQRILAPLGVEPAYVPSGQTLRVPGPGRNPLGTDGLRGIVRDDHKVHIIADAVQREARRIRASEIEVPSSPGPLSFGAAVAARRLGVPVRPRVGDDLVHRTGGLWGELARAETDGRFVPAKPLSELRIALVADEFTRATIASTVPTVVLRRATWRKQLEAEQFDALLVESAWEGVDKDWFHGIAYHGEAEAADLWELLEYARSQGIPTMFWNKEDPVHFRSFSLPASKFDYVFTTDADKVPDYLNLPGSAAVSVQSFPFFVSPLIHFPSGQPREQDAATIAFAGSFYGKRYVARSQELERILLASEPFGLQIYDRQHGREDSPYRFPVSLQKYVVPGVPYSEMSDVYRRHAIHVNVNSVRDSPTMFSRRVVEIAASGSLVLSGVGRGVSSVLGDAFPVLESGSEWDEMLAEVALDRAAWRQQTMEQFLAVMRAHRADQAISIMLRTAGIGVNPHSARQSRELVPMELVLPGIWSEALLEERL